MNVEILGEYFDIKEIKNVKEIKENESEILLITENETIRFDKEMYHLRLSYY